jgi:ketosteroid isomerase-like protein
MAEHPNAALVRRLFQAFDRRDIAAINDAIAEDAAWHFPGESGALAGEHRGREAILRFLANVRVLTSGTFHLELLDITASDDRAVALFTGNGTRPDGRTLQNPTALVISIRDGYITELREFVWDLPHVESFWE